MLKALVIALIMLVPGPCLGAADYVPDDQIPADLSKLIEADTKLLAFEAADLNGDGRVDYVFILEKQKKSPDDAEDEEGSRTLKIALRLADGGLKVVKTNDRIVFCATCGGVFGDPFAGLEAKTKTFSVTHYGGSSWRWSNTFQFNYSRIDDTWQLVMVEESSFHTSTPNKTKTVKYKPPKDFGKIDIADFDPEAFKGVGKK